MNYDEAPLLARGPATAPTASKRPLMDHGNPGKLTAAEIRLTVFRSEGTIINSLQERRGLDAPLRGDRRGRLDLRPSTSNMTSGLRKSSRFPTELHTP